MGGSRTIDNFSAGEMRTKLEERGHVVLSPEQAESLQSQINDLFDVSSPSSKSDYKELAKNISNLIS